MDEVIEPRRASKRGVGRRGDDGETTRKGVRWRGVGKAGQEEGGVTGPERAGVRVKRTRPR